MIDCLVDPDKERAVPAAKRCGYFEISPEFLCELLLLPKGIEITGVHENYSKRVIEIRIEGGDLPICPQGLPVTRVSPHYRRVFHSISEFVSWGI